MRLGSICCLVFVSKQTQPKILLQCNLFAVTPITANHCLRSEMVDLSQQELWETLISAFVALSFTPRDPRIFSRIILSNIISQADFLPNSSAYFALYSIFSVFSYYLTIKKKNTKHRHNVEFKSCISYEISTSITWGKKYNSRSAPLFGKKHPVKIRRLRLTLGSFETFTLPVIHIRRSQTRSPLERFPHMYGLLYNNNHDWLTLELARMFIMFPIIFCFRGDRMLRSHAMVDSRSSWYRRPRVSILPRIMHRTKRRRQEHTQAMKLSLLPVIAIYNRRTALW